MSRSNLAFESKMTMNRSMRATISIIHILFYSLYIFTRLDISVRIC